MLLKNTPKKQLGFRAFSNSVPKLWNALPPTIREADSSPTFRRRLKAHPFSGFLFQCLLDSLCTVTFLTLPQDFLLFLFGFSFESQWTQALKKRTCLSSSRLWLLTAEVKEDKYTIGYTHNWRFVTKKANMLRHAGKRDAKI